MRIRNNISKIVFLYVISLIAGFPLFMTDKYYAIQNDKMNFMLFATYSLAVCALIALIAGLFQAGRGRRIEELRDFIRIVGRSSALPVIAGFVFFVVINLSTFCSEWPYEAFWGNMGRYQGLYMWMIYLVGFFMIALFYEPRRWHIEVLVLIGAVISVWCVLDYFQLSPVGWQETIENYAKLDFSSGFGNINAVAFAEGIYLVTTAALLIREQNRLKSLAYSLICVIHIMGLTLAYSDNAVISIAASLAFLPFYAFSDKRGVWRYFSLYPIYAFGLFLVSLFALKPGDYSDMRSVREGILYDFSRTHGGCVIALLVGGIVLYGLVRLILRMVPDDLDQKKFSLRLKAMWGGVLAIFAVIGLYILYDANIAGHADRYGSLQNAVVFNDAWGTYRGYNWGLALSYIKNFSPRELIIGPGLETYSLYTFTYDYYNMVNTVGGVFDSPHNELLQMFFTTGIIGFISYYSIFAYTIVGGLRERSQVPAALSFGMITYILVSFVNVSAANTTVVAILFLGMASAYLRASSSDGYKKKEQTE